MAGHATSDIASRHPIHGIRVFEDVSARDSYTYTDADVGKVVKVSSPLAYYLVLSQSGGTATFSALGSSGSGITAEQHKALRQLIHFIDRGPAEGFASGAYMEILPAADPFPTSIIWWESSSKFKKIVEKAVTWDSIPKVPIQIQWKVYDTDGSSVLSTVTDAISYSGVFETSRTRTIA